jgi:hypothetical protein
VYRHDPRAWLLHSHEGKGTTSGAVEHHAGCGADDLVLRAEGELAAAAVVAGVAGAHAGAARPLAAACLGAGLSDFAIEARPTLLTHTLVVAAGAVGGASAVDAA